MAEKNIVVTDYKSYGKDDIQIEEKTYKKHYYFKKKSEIIEKKPLIKEKFQNFKNSFLKWTHTKQAGRVLIFSVLAILLIIGVFLWGALTKVKIGNYFLSEVNAILYENSSEEGIGIAKKMNISEFENKTTKEHFRTVTFTAKEQSSIYLNFLYFSLYSDYESNYDLSIIIKNPSFSSDFIYKTGIYFRANNTMEYKISLDLILPNPNNETTMTLEFIPQNDSIPFSVGNMKFIK